MIIRGIFLFLNCMGSVLSIGVEIEGMIDLGPKWSYEYKVLPIKSEELTTSIKNNNKEQSHLKKEIKIRKGNVDSETNYKKEQNFTLKTNDASKLKEEANSLSYEILLQDININKSLNDKFNGAAVERTAGPQNYKLNNNELSSQIYFQYSGISDEQFDEQKKIEKGERADRKHKKGNNEEVKNKIILKEAKVKDNIKIHNYTTHISKQSLKIFDIFKEMTNNMKIKHKIDKLRDNFKEKFNDFLKQNEQFPLKTNLAAQKVILNTIDTANAMIQRSIYYIAKDDFNRHLGNGYLFQKELNKQNQIEHVHACSKFGVCQRNEDYIQHIVNILTIILTADDPKLKQASDALTEIVKTSDYSHIIDSATEIRLKKSITAIESWDPFSMRAMFLIFRTVLLNRNKPLFIMDAADEDVAKKTESLLNLMDTINKQMNNVKNKYKWRENETQMAHWKDGKRKDVQSVLDTELKQLTQELEKLDYRAKESINNDIKSIIGK